MARVSVPKPVPPGIRTTSLAMAVAHAAAPVPIELHRHFEPIGSWVDLNSLFCGLA